jgi:hypothetical protein
MHIARAAVLGMLAAATVACGSCAGPQRTARLDAARADFATETRPARMMVQFDLATTRKLSPTEREQQEAKAASAFSPACVKPYTEKLLTRVRTTADEARASGALMALNPLPEYARVLDKEFDLCLHKFSVTGFNYMERDDGREQRIPEYLDELIVSLRAYGVAYAEAAADQQENVAFVMGALTAALAAGAAVNPNQTYVESYRRRDGTLVRGHLRTLPNETCLDNIRGCR